MYNVQVTPIIGLPHVDGWSHVTSGQGQRVIWALALEGEGARNLGRDLLDIIGQELPQSAADFYQIFAQVVAHVAVNSSRLSLAAAFFEEGVGTYAAHNAQVLLRREDKLGVLIDGLEGQKIVQGELRDGDLYILSSKQAIRFLDEVRLKISQGFETDSIVTSLTPSLQLESNTSLSALAFIKTSKGRFNLASQAAGRLDARNNSHTADQLRNHDQSAPVEKAKTNTAPPDLPADPGSLADPIGRHDRTAFGDPTSSVDSTSSADPATSVDSAPIETTKTNELGLPIRPDLVPEDWRSKSDSESDTGPVVDLSAVYTSIIARLKSLTSRLFGAASGGTKRLLPVIVPKIKALPSSAKKTLDFAQVLLKRLFSKDVYVTKAQSRRLARYLVIGLIIVLTIGAGVGWFSYRRSQALAEVRAELNPLAQRLDAASAQLNADPISVRDQVVAILDDLEALSLRFQDNRAAQPEIAQLKDQVKAVYEEVAGRDELQELPIRLRLTSFVDNFLTSSMSLIDQSLWLIDAPTNQLIRYSLDSDTADVAQMDLPAEGTVRDISALDSDRAVLLVGNQLQITNFEGQLSEIEESANFEGGRLVRSYADNLYVFNPSRNNLYRLGGDGQGYADSRVWLRSSRGIEFDDITSMTIDGDIWLGDRRGKIFRLRTGQPQDFAVSGLESDFSSDLYLYTRDDLEYLYVLEPDVRRVVLLTKEGAFVREIISASLASATALVVSDSGDRALIASGSLIYELIF